MQVNLTARMNDPCQVLKLNAVDIVSITQMFDYLSMQMNDPCQVLIF